MRADRFGSYSIVATFAGMSCLSRLKSMIAVHPLVAAAAPPRGELAAVVAPARLMQRLDQRLVRLCGRDLVEHVHGLKPPAGRRGIELANGHVTRPPGIPASSRLRAASRRLSSSPTGGRRSAPGASPCRARCRSGRCRPSRRAAVSIARRISTLLAPSATWNTSVRPSSRWMDVFSVMSGRRMTSVSFMRAPLAASRSRPASPPRAAR